MPNNYFQFKQFTIHQDRCAMKVTTDACLFGAWSADQIKNQPFGKLRAKIKNILDIGTGTGLLSLMLAQKISEPSIDSIEIDKDAFKQAKENIAASPWSDRINIIHADAKNFSFNNKYDIIISNPPFYENELKSDTKKKNIAHHSDDLSLKELLDIIKNSLSADGSFYLLLPYKRSDEIKQLLLRAHLFIRQLVFVKQSVKHDHFRIILEGKLKTDEQAETAIGEIAVWNEQQQYTDEFKRLLQDYYLHL